MADRRQKPEALRPLTHTSKPSLDTNASGLAESAISYSAFPEPPSSIPSTPIRSVFGESPSPSITGPLLGSPRYGPSQMAASYIPSPPPNPFPRSTAGGLEYNRAFISDRARRDDDSNSLSPYDWHEGASSIDVDAAEDRLLPTSFITSLLQENVGPRGANRVSYASDTLSGISEMTYPPKNHYTNSLRDNPSPASRVPSHRQSYRGPLPKPVGGRAPSSYQFRHSSQRSPNIVPDSHDSARTATASSSVTPPDSHQERPPAMARRVSVLSQSTLVAEPERSGKYGGKLAVHNEVDESDDSGYPADANTNSSSGYATSQTMAAQRRTLRNDASASRVRDSIHSTRSAAPSLMSRISSLRSIRRAFTWRRKPLPPVPTIPHIPIATEREHRRMEEETPLPDLVNRADRLHGLLEKGYHPHHSINSYPSKLELYSSKFDDAETVARYRNELVNPRPPSGPLRGVAWVKERKTWVIIGIFVLVAAAAIGAAVGVTAEKSKSRPRKSSCPANLGGTNCNLNATCVCTTSSSPCQNPMAQAILDLIPVMNDHLSTNITRSAVYDSLWIVQGSIQGSSCAQQVDVIDGVSSAVQTPNRTEWAQIALLWTLTQTQDPSSVTQLRSLIKKAPWAQLRDSDGPVTSAGSDFTTLVAGFDYDFAAQTITPHSSTFIVEGQPRNEQINKINTNIRSSLDRIYSFAVASSKQRDKALLNYWTTVLHQREDRLSPFKAAFSASPIILPLNGTSQSVRNLYNSTSSFPPPVACYPGLSANQRQLITAVEQRAFGIPPAADAPQFDSTCFPQHPVYGVLDVLRLRLPFLDPRTNVPRQGIILNSDVAPRAIIAVGEALSALPGSSNVTRSSELLVDPRTYGTTAFASHIILQYLSSVPAAKANAIIKHVLDPPAPIPPPPDPAQESDLFPLDSIPTLEVAVFGNIEGSDTGSYITGFTTSSGSLFFGSSDGSAFRTWAIGRGGKIAWAENATSPQVVYDDTFSDTIFNLTWEATANAISNNVPNVGLSNITDSFERNQRFSP